MDDYIKFFSPPSALSGPSDGTKSKAAVPSSTIHPPRLLYGESNNISNSMRGISLHHFFRKRQILLAKTLILVIDDLKTLGVQ